MVDDEDCGGGSESEWNARTNGDGERSQKFVFNDVFWEFWTMWKISTDCVCSASTLFVAVLA